MSVVIPPRGTRGAKFPMPGGRLASFHVGHAWARIALGVVFAVAIAYATGVRAIFDWSEVDCPAGYTRQPLSLSGAVQRCIPPGGVGGVGPQTLPQTTSHRWIGLYLANLQVRVFEFENGSYRWLATGVVAPHQGAFPPVVPPAASASARCDALVRTVLAGDQVTLMAAYESTAQEISLWMESGMVPGGGRAGPGQAPTRSLPPSESIASCYFDGTFTYRGSLPQGATPPRFERMLFLIDGSGVPIMTMGGSRHLFPLVRPQP